MWPNKYNHRNENGRLQMRFECDHLVFVFVKSFPPPLLRAYTQFLFLLRFFFHRSTSASLFCKPEFWVEGKTVCNQLLENPWVSRRQTGPFPDCLSHDPCLWAIHSTPTRILDQCKDQASIPSSPSILPFLRPCLLHWTRARRPTWSIVTRLQLFYLRPPSDYRC